MSQHKKRGFGAVFVAMAWCAVVSAQELSNSDMQGSSTSAEVSSEGWYTSSSASPEGGSDSSASSNSSCEYVDPATEVIGADSPEVTRALEEAQKQQPQAAARADVPNNVTYIKEKWCPGDIIKNNNNLCEMFVVGTTKTISGDCTEFACRPTGKKDERHPEGCPNITKNQGGDSGCYARRWGKEIFNKDRKLIGYGPPWTVSCECLMSRKDGCQDAGIDG